MADVTIKYKGFSVDCYGDIDEDQNIRVECDNEWDSFNDEGGYSSWTKAVHGIVDWLLENNPSAVPVQLESM